MNTITSYPQISSISVRFNGYGPAYQISPIDGRCQRNGYNALLHSPEWCVELMREAEKSGAWQTGIDSDRKQRGSAVNCDLYGYDEAQGLAVVQVRQSTFHPSRYTRVRKDYYLIGHTETGGFFAHPVDTPARSAKALATPEATVRFVLSRIWNCREKDLDDIERQGDVAFVPVPKIPETAVKQGGEIVIRDTHRLTGDVWKDSDGTLYTKRGARLVHTKRQHAPIKAKAGVYRVQPGIRAQNWGFTAPHGD